MKIFCKPRCCVQSVCSRPLTQQLSKCIFYRNVQFLQLLANFHAHGFFTMAICNSAQKFHDPSSYFVTTALFGIQNYFMYLAHSRSGCTLNLHASLNRTRSQYYSFSSVLVLFSAVNKTQLPLAFRHRDSCHEDEFSFFV